MAHEASSAAVQRAVDAVATPDVLRKWQVIQDNIGTMPNNALRDLVVDLTRSLVTSSGTPVVSEFVVQVIDDWYHRALFANTQQASYEEPVFTAKQWEAMPDRWFKGPPRLQPR